MQNVIKILIKDRKIVKKKRMLQREKIKDSLLQIGVSSLMKKCINK